MTDLEHRCDNGRPCLEVVLRLVAADKSRAEGFDDVARRLRATAERFAVLHDRGQRRELGKSA